MQLIQGKLIGPFHRLYSLLLSDTTRRRSEKVILVIAILSFLVHLAVIYLVQFGMLDLDKNADLLKNPIAAIYTPFSFILVYEVYLLIYYLPRSITTYISKQYEIITIIIRRLFKDLSSLTLSNDWFSIKYDLQFTYDLIASVLLFFIIFLFLAQSRKRYRTLEGNERKQEGVGNFIRIKKVLATGLVLVVVFLAIHSFERWLVGVFVPSAPGLAFQRINNVFFEQFFNILIIVDVVLLLFSFFHTDEFHKVMRNSGFIISTILIRVSFSVDGLLNTLLITAALLFGLLILSIHNRFEKLLAQEEAAAEGENKE